MSLLYDLPSAESILEFARHLEGKTIRQAFEDNGFYAGYSVRDLSDEMLNSFSSFHGKGGFGQYLETAYFGKKNDSLSRPDFPDAGLELKAAPLKRNKNGSIRAKERIVLGLFKYTDLVNETFETSHFLEKNTSVLIIFYFHDALKEYCDLEIPLTDIWQCLVEDGMQIRADWELIVQKTKEGKAHEISEGDTLFLGACTKGATRDRSRVVQPNSDILAQARAFCFKIQYVNHIYKILTQRKTKRVKEQYIRLLDNKPLSLEQQIMKRFEPYLGKQVDQICLELDLPYNPTDKGLYARIARTILGIRKKNEKIYEFDAAGIQIKTIRIEPNNRSKEEMSFKSIKYREIISREWEDSDLYEILTSKFFFIIYKRKQNNVSYCLDRIKMWNMPEGDLEIAHEVWEDTKVKIQKGDYNHFTRIIDEKIVHVRTHGRDSFSDLMETPQGTMQTKRSFWLNKKYIRGQID